MKLSTPYVLSLSLVIGYSAAGVPIPLFFAATEVKPAEPLFAERLGVLEFSGLLIVRPRQDLRPDRAAAARARLAQATEKYYADVDEYVLRAGQQPEALTAHGRAQRGIQPALDRGTPENALARELLATGDYQYVHPDWICYPVETVPNDPQWPAQWHHVVMQSAKAWDLTTGSSSVICAVTDTGIDLTHPDLAAHRVPGFNAVTDLAEVDGGDVSEINGHGTHVSGCAAAIGNNGVGVAGIGWNLRIMMCRVALDSGGGAYLDDILQAARWAIDHGAKVASSSYSGVDYAAIGTTGTYIKSRGGLYCYAAGNDARDLNGFDYADTIVVGASWAGEDRAGFSAYGRAVDVFAPGQDILSSCWGGGWCYASGTSMATPVCNGVIGMIWSANPALTPQQVEDILEHSCDDFGAPGNDDVYGWGRVNTFKGVKAALNAAGPQPPNAFPDGGTGFGGIPVTLDVLANDYDVNGDTVAIGAFDTITLHGGTVVRSVATGPGGRDQLIYTAPAGYFGPDSFSYTAIDPGGLGASALVSLTVDDLSQYRTPENPIHIGPAIDVAYYIVGNTIPPRTHLPDFNTLTPYRVEAVPDINIPSTGGVFGNSGRADAVGAVYTGYITVPANDIYTLSTESDDGSRLFLGTTLVVDNDGIHGMQERAGTIKLKAGTHALRVEFFERAGGCGLMARIASPAVAKQVIPAAMFKHHVCPSDFNGDGFVTGDDFDGYADAFVAGTMNADFNGDGFVTGDDFDAFNQAFVSGC